jgi:hypothetical protein
MLLERARAVHTVGMRFAIDVAFCTPDTSDRPVPEPASEALGELVVPLVVLDTATMVPYRLGRPRWRSRYVIEAEAGAFERWRLRPGDQLEIR